MRRVFSIILYSVAGYFFFAAMLVGYVNVSSLQIKRMIVLICLGLAGITLFGGLAINRFHRWRRETGIVLVSSSGFGAFTVFTMVCLLASEEFRKMMKPESLKAFGDYYTGTIVIILLGLMGWRLLKTSES